MSFCKSLVSNYTYNYWTLKFSFEPKLQYHLGMISILIKFSIQNIECIIFDSLVFFLLFEAELFKVRQIDNTSETLNLYRNSTNN